jgi:hypothetical protein
VPEGWDARGTTSKECPHEGQTSPQETPTRALARTKLQRARRVRSGCAHSPDESGISRRRSRLGQCPGMTPDRLSGRATRSLSDARRAAMRAVVDCPPARRRDSFHVVFDRLRAAGAPEHSDAARERSRDDEVVGRLCDPRFITSACQRDDLPASRGRNRISKPVRPRQRGRRLGERPYA